MIHGPTIVPTPHQVLRIGGGTAPVQVKPTPTEILRADRQPQGRRRLPLVKNAARK